MIELNFSCYFVYSVCNVRESVWNFANQQTHLPNMSSTRPLKDR